MDKIGKYVVSKTAVTTGYARVFFASDPDLHVPVAIKLFAPRVGGDNPMSPAQLLARFLVEARALASVDHPYVITVKTLETLGDGRPYFVMPYMAAHLPFEIGHDVAGEAKRLPLWRAHLLLKQISAALASLHRKGLVHRALKPSNILLTARENGSVKLADFSMVKLPDRNPPLPDHWVGATEYCAPEQRETATAVGPQADIYSLGVLAYRMLTGTLPDPAKGAAILPGDFPDLLVQLVKAATDPDPERRPAHGGIFLNALETVPVQRPKPTLQIRSIQRPGAKKAEASVPVPAPAPVPAPEPKAAEKPAKAPAKKKKLATA